MWSEAATVLIGGGLVGTGVGWFVAFALIKVLGGVFDPPPEGLTVPWIYLSSLGISAAALTAVGVEFLLAPCSINPLSANCALGCNSSSGAYFSTSYLTARLALVKRPRAK